MASSDSSGGLLETLERPFLPPLPPMLRSERGITNPFISTAPTVEAAPEKPAIELTSPADEIVRPDLPPTPPELKPLSARAKSSQTFAAQSSRPAPTPNKANPALLASAQAPAVEKKKDESKGSGSSIVKPLLGVALLLAFIAGLVFFASRQLEGTSLVSQLETGECVEDFFEVGNDGEFVEINTVSVIDCAEPHAYEVFSVNADLFPDDQYPGVEEAFAIGQSFCLNEYQEFIGGGLENLSSWDVWTFVPPEDSFDDERLVQCLVGDFNETTPATGTLRSAAAR